MKDLKQKREREKAMLADMIRLYCKRKHHCSELCPDCQKLYDYAMARVEHCPMMETKTFCSNCPVHCYRAEMRERIREVMRFCGPRMLFYHPIAAISHMIDTAREKRRLRKEKALYES